MLYWRPSRPPAETALWRFWHAAAGFDWLYDRLLVRPILWAARVDRDDFIDDVYDGVAWVTRVAHRAGRPHTRRPRPCLCRRSGHRLHFPRSRSWCSDDPVLAPPRAIGRWRARLGWRSAAPRRATLDRARRAHHRSAACVDADRARRLLGPYRLDRELRSPVDSATRHFIRTRSGRAEPGPGSAHHRARSRLGGDLLDRNHRSRRPVSRQPALDRCRRHRRVHRPRSVPVLLLLGTDAGADVFHHRAMGP